MLLGNSIPSILHDAVKILPYLFAQLNQKNLRKTYQYQIASSSKIPIDFQWVGVLTESTTVNEEECLNA